MGYFPLILISLLDHGTRCGKNKGEFWDCLTFLVMEFTKHSYTVCEHKPTQASEIQSIAGHLLVYTSMQVFCKDTSFYNYEAFSNYKKHSEEQTECVLL